MEPRTDFPYRLAAVDLDNTLLGPDKRISTANRAAVERLRELGVRVMLASGRCHSNMLAYHRELGLDGLVVSSQGAMVRHAETDEILHQHLIPARTALAAIEQGERLGFSTVVYHPRASYVGYRNSSTDLYLSRTSNPLVQVEDWSNVVEPGVLKVLWLGPADRVTEHCPKVGSQWDGELETLITDPEYLELMPYQVSKAVGVDAAARHYGFTASQVLTFGDGNNDASMLRWAGLGVAMSHSVPAAKDAADRIAPPGDPETDFARAVAALLPTGLAAASG